jgi:hypothetical protein
LDLNGSKSALPPDGSAESAGRAQSVYAAAEAKAEAIALGVIRERFEGGQVPEHMHYHNSEHTAGVIVRARAIGLAIDMSDRDLLLLVIAAAFHDIVQYWSPEERADGTIHRRRHAGRNEVASAYEAIEAMAELGVDFHPEEQGIVASAIIGTIPGWDHECATVVQPFLVEHGVVRSLALADIGSAGMDPSMYRLDGPNLFAEENLDIMAALSGARRGSDIGEAAQRAYRARYVAWLKVQPEFARGRRECLVNGELEGLDVEHKARVERLFCHFEESIAASEAAARDAETLPFVQLMRQLDPEAFPDEA